MAGVSGVGNFADAISRVREDELAVVAELKAGNEAAYEWLIAHYHQPIYSLIYRMVNDPADAADTTQEVFIKVFRGIHRFHGDSSLKTWLYRIALHEAANQKRWWCRHKGRETSMESKIGFDDDSHFNTLSLKETLVDHTPSPFDGAVQEEVRTKVEFELSQIAEPYRTTLILRDIEDLSYEEIAEVLEISIGTVKSRLVRGREALRKRLQPYIDRTAQEVTP
ncbi:MAG: sigma-70 family RNA polymerase sigma factor [Acidobacteriales bacterium]|nr:sigma-70 family RNA polymerase sigma factor [Terriglobales bacterium]